MNKIFKCAFGLLTLFTLNIACFSNATFLIAGTDDVDMSLFEYHYRVPGGTYDLSPDNYGMTCVKFDEQYPYANFTDNVNHSTISDGLNDRALVCSDSTNLTLQFSTTRSYYYFFFSYENWINELFPKLTSLQCQTEYNLIPVSEVTPNYCALNFGMIDPQECPINQGTGAIVRSNLMINDVPYAQNQNINVFIPDFLSWNLSFNDLYTVIEVEGYNADEEYIENVINQEKLTPTPEDFTYLIQGTANFIPYLFIGLLILFAVKIFGKVWK